MTTLLLLVVSLFITSTACDAEFSTGVETALPQASFVGPGPASDAVVAFVSYPDCHRPWYFVATGGFPPAYGFAPSVSAASDSVVARLSPPQGAGSISWSPGSVTATRGSRVTTDLVVSGSGFAGVQVDLSAPVGYALAVERAPGAPGSFAQSTLANGSIRAVLYGSPLASGGAVFRVSVTAASSGAVTFSNAIAAADDPNGTTTTLTSLDTTFDVALDARGDIDGDGDVDVADVVALVDIVLGGPDTYGRADVNSDGAVNVGDVVSLAKSVANGRFPDGSPLPSRTVGAGFDATLQSHPGGGYTIVPSGSVRAVHGRVSADSVAATDGNLVAVSDDGGSFVAYAIAAEMAPPVVRLFGPQDSLLTGRYRAVLPGGQEVDLVLGLPTPVDEGPVAALALRVYPNPSTGRVVVEGGAGLPYEVFDATGRRVQRGDHLPETLVVEAPGLYAVRVAGETATFVVAR